MNLIVCIDEKNAIGRDDSLLVHIPDDLKYFKKMTVGKTVVGGRITMENLPGGKPLAERKNILLTRDKNYKNIYYSNNPKDENHICNDYEKILSLETGDDVFIIGGESIYELFLDYCDTAYITRFYDICGNSYDGNKFFPFRKIADNDKWILKSRSELFEYENIRFEFLKYKQI